MRLVSTVLVVVCALSVRAHAENWRAVGELQPPSLPSCPRGVPILELQLEGSRFSGKSQAGKTFATSIAPDGGVNVSYQGVNLYGTVTIVGNALSRQLELSGSAAPGCRYALREQRGPAAYRWTASMNLVGGTYRNCGDPPYADYKIEIAGQTFIGVPYGGRNASTISLDLTSLKPDGSGRVNVTSPRGVVFHFDFEAGTGPRRIHFGGDNNECRFELQPK